MAISEILVHVDELPAAEARLRAAVEVAAATKAHVSALLLVTEPFMRALVGRHLPEEFVREHLAMLEREADERLAALTADRRRQGREARGTARDGRHGPPAGDPGPAGPAADLVVVGPGTDTDELALTEAAFMDTGRPALVVPAAWSGNLPPKRALVAWDGSREAARAAGDAVPLLQAAEDVVVLTVDAHRGGARFSDQPGFGLTTYLTRHGAKARVKQVVGLGRHRRHHPRPGRRGEGGPSGDGRLRPFAPARDDVRWRYPPNPRAHDHAGPPLTLSNNDAGDRVTELGRPYMNGTRPRLVELSSSWVSDLHHEAGDPNTDHGDSDKLLAGPLLLVECSHSGRAFLQRALTARGFVVTGVSGIAQAEAAIAVADFAYAVISLRLRDGKRSLLCPGPTAALHENADRGRD